MRDAACLSFEKRCSDENFVFLTGDLGFQSFDVLARKRPERFFNCGVAEQNMVTVAAGLAHGGFSPWVYSIAPFVYARPFEQIRNDVCLHHLPVKLVGNGGGFGYGVMGATHHALEDYGVLLTLQGLRVYVPCFAEDVEPMVERMSALAGPSYLRLGKSENLGSFQVPAYEAWRKLVEGEGRVILGIGSLVGSLLETALALPTSSRPEIWVLGELPLQEHLPSAFLASLQEKRDLAIVDEHVRTGGLGEALACRLLMEGISLKKFRHHFVKGYLSGTYGSQAFHRVENGLHAANIFTE
jgi:transketolase